MPALIFNRLTLRTILWNLQVTIYQKCKLQSLKRWQNKIPGTENVDFNRYPDGTYRRFWLKVYLEEFGFLNNLAPCTENDVTKLDNQVQLSVAVWFIVCAVIYATVIRLKTC